MEGAISEHNPKKSKEKHHLSILALGCSSKKQDGSCFPELGCAWRSRDQPCWEGEKRAPGLELSLGPSSRGAPKTRLCLPACLRWEPQLCSTLP